MMFVEDRRQHGEEPHLPVEKSDRTLTDKSENRDDAKR